MQVNVYPQKNTARRLEYVQRRTQMMLSRMVDTALNFWLDFHGVPLIIDDADLAPTSRSSHEHDTPTTACAHSKAGCSAR